MFRAPLCPSSGAREYYTVGCCLWYMQLRFSDCPYGVEVRVVCPVCGLLQQLENQALKTTGSNQLYNTLELLMMGIMVPKTCWASNKICNKKHLLHVVGILFPHINDDAQSKSLQIYELDSITMILTLGAKLYIWTVGTLKWNMITFCLHLISN
jgi:hypothetical protein